MPSARAVFILINLIVAGASRAGLAAGPAADRDCLHCHANPDLVGRRLVVTLHLFGSGPHVEENGVACVSCHVQAASLRNVTRRGHGPLGKAHCSDCHDAAAQIQRGAHAEGGQGRSTPSCQSCHGAAHRIRMTSDPVSPASRGRQPRTCGRCHGGATLQNFLLPYLHTKDNFLSRLLFGSDKDPGAIRLSVGAGLGLSGKF